MAKRIDYAGAFPAAARYSCRDDDECMQCDSPYEAIYEYLSDHEPSEGCVVYCCDPRDGEDPEEDPWPAKVVAEVHLTGDQLTELAMAEGML